MSDLKLIALDTEDLDVVSATTQDAIVRVGDMAFARGDRRFALMMNRFAWEHADGRARGRPGVRKRAALHFDHVTGVRAAGFDLSAHEGVLELLSIRFTEAVAPGGHVDLVFAGGAAIRLDVEVLEARLQDLGAAWAARLKPEHVG